MTEQPLLAINNLHTYFYTDQGTVRAVNDVSFTVRKGETLGLVGESGCGKSVTALSVLRLIPHPPGKIVQGRIRFDGRDLTQVPLKTMRAIRGKKISMIFQEPMTSLNPVYTIGNQLVEAILLHSDRDEEEAELHAIDMLKKVGISDADDRFDDYPHQMSGGMKQRVMIAMAIACNPQLVIADEPTTALDVTIRAQILDLMRSLQDEFHMSILLITHDLGVIADMAHRVVVMYASKVVETGDVNTIFAEPRHPYSLGLFNSIPRLDREQERLDTIPGQVPVPLHFPEGCKFHPRCKYAMPICKKEEPPLMNVEGDGHTAACWLNDPEQHPGGWQV